MRHNRFLAMLLFASCAAQSSRSTPLSSKRWIPAGACYTNNGLELECVREMADARLRLVHRNFGQRDSDTGFQFGAASLSFAHPSSIKSITTDVVVQRIEESNCLANPEYGAHADIDATFFNTGTGDPNDDVGTVLALGRSFSDPPGQLTVFSQIGQGGNYSYFFLGTVAIGTPVTLTTTWDRPNHVFLVSWTNLVTHVKTDQTMPYSFSDTTPAVNPGKVLTVNTFPANCTAQETWVYIDASFKNVYVNNRFYDF
jgi:hypothetical protein